MGALCYWLWKKNETRKLQGLTVELGDEIIQGPRPGMLGIICNV